MKAYVFSIGEKTTDLCVDLMTSYGYEVILYQDDSTLWDKLKRFYTDALKSTEQEFVRIDADIIPNRNVLRLENTGWQCATGYDWYKQDRGSISIHLMDRTVIDLCYEKIEDAKPMNRPETFLWRQPDINPLTSAATDFSCGIHGYGQQDQRQRIMELKSNRNQNYDWELIEKIEAL